MGSSSPGKVQNSYQAEKVYVPRSYRETGLAQTRTIVPLDQYSTPVLLDPEEDDVDNDEGMQDSRPYRAARQVHANSRRPEISLELSRVLEYLSTLLQHYDQSFEAKRLGFAMMGLNHLSSSVPEVKKLLEIIAIKANGAWGEINGQELSMCMHGKFVLRCQKEYPIIQNLLFQLHLLHICHFYLIFFLFQVLWALTQSQLK